METLLIAADENARQIPNLNLSEKIFKYEHFSKSDKSKALSLQEEILAVLIEDNMAPLYKLYCEKFKWEFDKNKYDAMIAFVEKELKSIDDKKEKALEHAGDSEVVDAMYDKAKLYCSAGYWEEANTAYDEVINTKKKITSNKKIDAYCEKSRIALYTMNVSKLSDLLEETKKLNESGGDWDRRNRLKVYEALYFISNNEVKKAGPLLLECIETFTCTEICTYESFIFYTVLINIITLPRTELYKKVIKNPQVIAMIGDIPHLEAFLHAIYNCDYAKFFREMIALLPAIGEDKYLSVHMSLLVREYKILAFSQYLEAYKSVMLSTMAAAFGISVSMLDTEISKCIASGRISAKIDKEGDAIENSVKYDKRSNQYEEVITKGDLVLNQIQKLARSLEM